MHNRFHELFYGMCVVNVAKNVVLVKMVLENVQEKSRSPNISDLKKNDKNFVGSIIGVVVACCYCFIYS